MYVALPGAMSPPAKGVEEISETDVDLAASLVKLNEFLGLDEDQTALEVLSTPSEEALRPAECSLSRLEKVWSTYLLTRVSSALPVQFARE